MDEKTESELLRILQSFSTPEEFTEASNLLHEEWRRARNKPAYWHLNISGKMMDVVPVSKSGAWRIQHASHTEGDEEVIDTTKPEFAQQFKGFINAPGRQSATEHI